MVPASLEDNVCRSVDGVGGAAVLNRGFTLTFTSAYRRNRVEAIAGPARGGAFAHLAGSLDLTTSTFAENAVTGPGERRGAAVYAAASFVVNGSVVRDHGGDHAGGAVAVDGVNAVAGFTSFASAEYVDNEVGGMRVDDPDGRLEIRVGSSSFCRNTPFDVRGPFTDWGGNGVCCPGDLDGNGVVSVGDLVRLLGQWGPCPGCPADLDGDEVVTVADLVALLAGWGDCPDRPRG